MKAFNFISICLAGAMTAGALADRWGRKPLLITAAMLFTVSAVATGLFNDFTMFNIARFIGGIGIGVASALSPMYIAEVSPAEIRGRMVSLNQMTIVLGILGAQIVNMLIGSGVSEEWGMAWGWRWMFWAETIPAGLFLVMSFFIPESPVFLKMKGLSPALSQGEGDLVSELVIQPGKHNRFICTTALQLGNFEVLGMEDKIVGINSLKK